MEWLTEHFDVLVPIALVLFFLVQKLFIGEQGEEDPSAEQSELEAEARRIKEEIRRKIIARQQGRSEEFQEEANRPAAYVEEEAERPVTFPRRQERPPPVRMERETARSFRSVEPEPEVATTSSRDMQDELRIQMERLREAREAKAEAVRRTSARGLRKAERTSAAVAARGGDLRAQLLSDLATGDSMKRAFLLKEIVDRPIGLRDRPDVFSNWY